MFKCAACMLFALFFSLQNFFYNTFASIACSFFTSSVVATTAHSTISEHSCLLIVDMFIVHIPNVLSYFNLLWVVAAAAVPIEKHEDGYTQSTMGGKNVKE